MKGSRSAIGRQREMVSKLLDIKVMDGSGARFTLEERVNGLLTVRDAAGGAEFFELFGKKRNERAAVRFAVGMEESLLKGVKVVLKFGVLHTVSNCYTNDATKGFNRGVISMLGRCRMDGASRKSDARYLMQILDKGDAFPALEESFDSVALALANLEREQAARF